MKRQCVRPWPARGMGTGNEVGEGSVGFGICVIPGEALGSPLQPFITNFACNSVVRQIDNGEKTSEFQRYEFKV